MADDIQGQPGEQSQATATETSPPAAAPQAEPGAADNTTATTNPPAPEKAVDWDKVDAGDYQRMKAELFGADAEQGEPAPEATTNEPGATAQPVEDPKADPAPTSDHEDDAGPYGDKFRPRLGKLPKVKQETVQLVREMEEAGTPIDFAEAESRVKAKYGLTDTTPDPKATEKQDAPKSVADIDKEIADLRAAKNAAAKQADLEKMVEIDEQIEAAREAKVNAERAESAALTAAEQRLADAKRQVRESYPDFQDEKSPLSKEFQRVYDELEAESSPILQTTPEKQLATISRMAAANLGIKPADPKAAPKQQSPASTLSPSSPARPVQPASGSARTVRPATEQQVQRIASIKTMDDYEKAKAELLAAS